jgi:hypothetical protein
MDTSKIAELLATILTITGFYLLSENMLITGFGISCTANILWLIWSADAGARGIFLVNSLLFLSGINGLFGTL